MRYILIFLLPFTSFAQDTLTAEQVAPFTYAFNITETGFEGPGSFLLQKEMKVSQFVLLGETHDDYRIAEFTSTLLPELAKEGFGHFLTENGRYSLQLMLEEASQASTLKKGFHSLLTGEFARLNDYPIPFLTGVEDAHFMEVAKDHGYAFYGIDQEFFYAFPYLFDQLYTRCEDKDAVKESYEAAMDFMMAEYANESKEKNYPFCANMLSSEAVNTYFEQVNRSQDVDSLISDIRRSWEIYSTNRTDRKASFVLRGDLMKERFLQYYNQQITPSEPLPKILIKLGSLHTMTGTTPLGIEDIGETVHQLAEKNGTGVLNITFMFRYFLDEEEELGYFDNAEGNSKWLNERKPFMLQGKPDKWTIIDLTALSRYTERLGIYVYPPLATLMAHHGYVIIPPASRDATPNYTVE